MFEGTSLTAILEEDLYREVKCNPLIDGNQLKIWYVCLIMAPPFTLLDI